MASNSPVLMRKGMVVSRPPTGFVSLNANASGAAYLLDALGNQTPVGTSATGVFFGPSALDDQQILLTGLAGQTDGGHRIEGWIKMPAGGGTQRNYTLRPNSLAPVGDWVGTTEYYGPGFPGVAAISTDFGQVANVLNIGYQGAGRAAGFLHFWIECWTKANLGSGGRLFRSWAKRDDGVVFRCTATWLDDTTTIDSQQIFASQPNSILANSGASIKALGMLGV